MAWGRFQSQNAKNTSCSEHFWKLRYSKSARRCGAKHISKSKCKRHTMLGRRTIGSWDPLDRSESLAPLLLPDAQLLLEPLLLSSCSWPLSSYSRILELGLLLDVLRLSFVLYGSPDSWNFPRSACHLAAHPPVPFPEPPVSPASAGNSAVAAALLSLDRRAAFSCLLRIDSLLRFWFSANHSSTFPFPFSCPLAPGSFPFLFGSFPLAPLSIPQLVSPQNNFRIGVFKAFLGGSFRKWGISWCYP